MENLKDIYDIKQVLNGDTDSFSNLVKRYNSLIFSIVLQITHSTEDAEEITQDVFIKIFNSLDKFKQTSKFSTWAYRIAYNTAISKIRKRKVETVPIDFVGVKIDDNEYDYEKELMLNKLTDAIKMLPSEESILITLHYTKSIPIKEIAEIVDQSETNIKTKLFRVRKKLQKLLSDEQQY